MSVGVPEMDFIHTQRHRDERYLFRSVSLMIGVYLVLLDAKRTQSLLLTRGLVGCVRLRFIS